MPDVFDVLGPVGAKCTFLTVQSRHDDLDLKKTGNPFYDAPTKSWRIFKRVILNGAINWHYEAAVNRQRNREGAEADFEAKPRTWGTRVPGTPFVHHIAKDGTSKRYLELKVERTLSVEYRRVDTLEIVPESEIASFRPIKAESRQGVEREIILRDINVTNIEAITLAGEKIFVGFDK